MASPTTRTTAAVLSGRGRRPADGGPRAENGTEGKGPRRWPLWVSSLCVEMMGAVCGAHSTAVAPSRSPLHRYPRGSSWLRSRGPWAVPRDPVRPAAGLERRSPQCLVFLALFASWREHWFWQRPQAALGPPRPWRLDVLRRPSRIRRSSLAARISTAIPLQTPMPPAASRWPWSSCGANPMGRAWRSGRRCAGRGARTAA